MTGVRLAIHHTGGCNSKILYGLTVFQDTVDTGSVARRLDACGDQDCEVVLVRVSEVGTGIKKGSQNRNRLRSSGRIARIWVDKLAIDQAVRRPGAG